MLTARFAAELPPDAWTTAVSREFSDCQLRLLTGITVDDHAVELGEVRGEDAPAATEAVAAHPDVLEHEVLHAGEQRVLAQYRTSERSLYEFLRHSSVPPEFPVVVEDGWFELSVTGSREQVRQVRQVLAAGDGSYEVLSVGPAGDAGGVLTDRQREVLEAALREGYLEVPRSGSLAAVADAVGVDPSTASGVIRRGQSRLVRWYLSGADTVEGRNP
jgi:predicted DNA binding protein